MDLLSTVKNSYLEDFFPKGWDLAKIDKICAMDKNDTLKRETFWNKDFHPVSCENIVEFDMKMGHEIACVIKTSRDAGEKLAMILPVGPMGMYKWAVYFLKEWNVSCDHVSGFNMDEWSDHEGNTLESSNEASFQNAMLNAFYGPLGELTFKESNRNFATKTNLPTYAEKINDLKAKGAKLVTVFGIGRVFHIAFWEPHFAGEFSGFDEWKQQTHRLGAKLHPLTIEQNAITSFKSRTTLVPCTANTIGPNLFLNSDYIIGGCDGVLNRGMMWQGMSFKVTLKYAPDIWLPSTFMPTLKGKLFYLDDLANSLNAECN